MQIRVVDVIKVAVSFLLAAFAVLASAQEPPACSNGIPDAPFDGYSPTGYKGGLERSPIWFKRVRKVSTSAGMRYALKSAQRGAKPALYESLEPIFLGGTAYGFIARTGTCSILIDTHGQALLPGQFGKVQDMLLDRVTSPSQDAPDAVTLKFELQSPEGEIWHMARFVKGRLVARSPHSYALNNPDLYRSPVMKKGASNVPGWDYKVVSLNGKLGVLRLSDLAEVIEPVFAGVVAIPTDEGRREAWVVDTGSQWALRAIDGALISTSRFDDFERMRGGLAAVDYLALIDRRANTCRFYDQDLKPLLEQDVPLELNGECSGFDMQDGLLVVPGKDGQLQGLRLNRDGRVSKVFDTGTGDLVARARNGVLIVQEQVNGAARYRLLSPFGQPLSGLDFDAFANRGCDFFQVKKGDVWYWPDVDGRLSTKDFFPVSC